MSTLIENQETSSREGDLHFTNNDRLTVVYKSIEL